MQKLLLQQRFQHSLPEYFKKQKWDEEGFDGSPTVPPQHCTLESSSALSREASPSPQQQLQHSPSPADMVDDTGMKGRATLGESPQDETTKWSPATATGLQDQHPTPPDMANQDEHHVWAGSMKSKSQPPRAAEYSQTIPSLPKKQPLVSSP